MRNRRAFLYDLSMLGLGSHLISYKHCQPLMDDSNWEVIKSQYPTNKLQINNFNTGSAGVMPIDIYTRYITSLDEVNNYAPYEAIDAYQPEYEIQKARLASLVGAKVEEIALVTNTTQGINMILGSLSFTENDEVVIANIDYPYAENTISNKIELSGAQLRKVNIDLSKDDEDTILSKYKSSFSSNTKLVLLTFMTHREGQILPIKKLIELAHEHNVEVLVDAAHIVGQVELNISDLNCDYLVSSLHKWLSAPLGTGMLYVATKHIPKLKGAYAYYKKGKGDISKFEYLGTRAFQNMMTLGSCLDFLEVVGAKKKQQRLDYLKKYLADGLQQLKGCKLRTDLDRSCGILSFEPGEVYPSVFVATLKAQFKIHVKSTGYPKDRYVRASVNLHHVEEDIDAFILATDKIMSKS